MATRTVTVTGRSRKLGYAWAHEVEEWYDHEGRSHLRVRAPRYDDAVYDTPRKLAQLRREVRKRNQGNEIAEALFYNGMLVVGEVWPNGEVYFGPHNIVSEALHRFDLPGNSIDLAVNDDDPRNWPDAR